MRSRLVLNTAASVERLDLAGIVAGRTTCADLIDLSGGAIVSHIPRIDFGIGDDPGMAGGGRLWSRRRWQPYAPRRSWV